MNDRYSKSSLQKNTSSEDITMEQKVVNKKWRHSYQPDVKNVYNENYDKERKISKQNYSQVDKKINANNQN